MTLLNIDTLELISTLRRAPANGAPSSHDFNDGEQEKLTDLAAFADFVNTLLRPILNALPATALEGLEGRTLLTDTTDQGALFFDALNTEPLTVADSLRLLQGIVNSVSGQVVDLGVEVGQLSAKLSATSQNDFVMTLNTIQSTLNQIQTDQRALEARLAALETPLPS
jgi:hypothetical protein